MTSWQESRPPNSSPDVLFFEDMGRHFDSPEFVAEFADLIQFAVDSLDGRFHAKSPFLLYVLGKDIREANVRGVDIGGAATTDEVVENLLDSGVISAQPALSGLHAVIRNFGFRKVNGQVQGMHTLNVRAVLENDISKNHPEGYLKSERRAFQSAIHPKRTANKDTGVAFQLGVLNIPNSRGLNRSLVLPRLEPLVGRPVRFERVGRI